MLSDADVNRIAERIGEAMAAAGVELAREIREDFERRGMLKPLLPPWTPNNEGN